MLLAYKVFKLAGVCCLLMLDGLCFDSKVKGSKESTGMDLLDVSLDFE